MGDPLIIGVLGDYFRESVVIGLLGVIVVLRFRRYRAAGARRSVRSRRQRPWASPSS